MNKNEQIIEELKAIPQASGIVEFIEGVVNIDDAILNEDSIKMILDTIDNQLDEEQKLATIDAIFNQWRANGFSIEKAKEDCANTLTAFNEIKNNLELSENKQKIVDAIFNEMAEIINVAAEEYFIEDIKIFVEKVHENAQLPTYADFASSGADIYATEDFVIPKSSRGKLVKTGLKMGIPLGWELQCRPRSGLSLKTAMRIANAPGTIDAGYPEEVGVIIDNLSSKDIEIKAGDRIAQLVVSPVYRAKFEEVPSVAEYNEWSPRSGGFGSTGK